MSSVVIVLALCFLLACGTQAQPQQATIEGDSNQIQMKVPGATLTFAATTNGSAPSNNWKTSYVASDLLREAVAGAVQARVKGMTTPALLSDTLEAYATREDLMDLKYAQKVLVTSVSIPTCDESRPQKTCASGNVSHTATFYGFGFGTTPDLFRCAIIINDVQILSSVVVGSLAGGRSWLSCDLPGAYYEENAVFAADVYVIEGSSFRIPHAYTNPLIKYFNDGPIIQGFENDFAEVTGEGSVLSIDGKTVNVVVNYNDFYDIDAELTVVASAVTTNTIESFAMDRNTKTLSIQFIKSWMDAFLLRTDQDVDGLIGATVTISMTVTDSHSETTTKELNLTIVQAIPSWSTDGSSSLLSSTARKSILTRLGMKQSAQLKLCYSIPTHGWGATLFHTACDNKGTLLMILKTVGSDRILGGYYMKSMTSTCNYQHVGVIGDVADGEAAADRAWLFHIKDNAPTEVNYAYQYYSSTDYKYTYYECGNYHMTFGGGFDWYCSDTQCYCNIGFTYRVGDDVSPGVNWCTGTQYTYPTAGTGFEFYEVYVVQDV